MCLSSSCQLEILYEYDLLKQDSIWFAASSHECIEISQQHSKITTRTYCFSFLKARSFPPKKIASIKLCFDICTSSGYSGYVPGLSFCSNVLCKKIALEEHKSLQLSTLEVESKLQTSFGHNFASVLNSAPLFQPKKIRTF